MTTQQEQLMSRVERRVRLHPDAAGCEAQVRRELLP